MRTEQKIFNELIETIVNNSENNEAKITNVELWAKTWKEEMKQALTLTGVGSSTEFKVWDELFSKLAWKFKPTKSGDMMIDAEEVYNELKGKFELKRK
tara:strand:- start:98 stop:391 length:294 start_codon:yes stop_codon:yes gene_type:complete